MNFLFFLLAAPLAAQTVHSIAPGQNPQAIADAAAPGDRLVFLPGVHEHPPRQHRSLLYVAKSLDIELQPGATLRLAAGQTKLEKTPEITTDHGAPKTIDDFEPGGDYDLGLGATIFTVKIDGTSPDTFSWGVGELFAVEQERVPITGDWQLLKNGVKIRFASRTGHSVGSLWFASYDGPESYGIRIGHGTQPNFIENVRIFGQGTIDLNSANNVQPSGLVKNISASVLVHGRVRNVDISGITMTNTMRSVMLYGEHTGKFLQGGATAGGESFDAENISITRTRTINPTGAAYLLGHPSHRGKLSKVRCNYNHMESATTSLEPNFNLDQYEVIGNVIKSAGRAIHCWRRSTNGLIKDNVRIDDPTGREVVMVNAPGAWQQPENIILRDNRNHLSEPVGYWANVVGGKDNLAPAAYSTAMGLQARTKRTGEVAYAAGAFQVSGDAQASQLVVRAATVDASPVEFSPAIPISPKASVAYRILIVARSEGGREQATFEAVNGKVTVLSRTNPAINLTAELGSALRLKAFGLPGTPMRWVAKIDLAEVEF